MNKHVTVKDIAKELGIHHTTVSRALRNHPEISPATKELVRQKARELNYLPNTIAQNLKSRTTRTIGIIVPQIGVSFFSKAISGIEKIAYENDYIPMVLQSNESEERERLALEAMMTNRVAGIIISMTEQTLDYSRFDAIRSRQIPLVFFDRAPEDYLCNRVIFDDKKGAYLATEHLIKKGYHKIAYIGGPMHLQISRDRFSGYKKALEDHRLQFVESLTTFGNLHEENGYTAMELFLRQSERPEAVMTVNDPVAIGAYNRIKKAGLKIPEDLALIGFSNNDITAYVEPSITTIEQFPEKMGIEAMKMLLRQLNGFAACSPELCVIQPKLITRQSA